MTAISTVLNALDTATRDFDSHGVVKVIQSGGKDIRARVEAIRKQFRSELDKHGDYKRAKESIDQAKKRLPGVVWSGTFTERAGDKLVHYSGLLCADLDHLGTRLKEVRETLSRSPYAWAVFLSPSGDGLKMVFRVPADVSKHLGSFRAVERHVKELVGVQIDESCKDVARLCFLSYDPQVFHNPDAVEIEPLPEPEKPRFISGASVDLSARQRVVNEILVAVDWQSETSGLTTCPGKHLHTTGNGDRDCRIDLDQVPTLHCFHDSCRGILDGVNHELRSRIGKAEWTAPEPAKPQSANTGQQTNISESHEGQKSEHHFTLISAKDLLAEPDVETRWLLEGMLIDAGMSLLVAKPKVGKTTFAFYLAVAVARGDPFLGYKTTQGQVVYLALEENRHQIKQQLRDSGVSEELIHFHFGAAPLNAIREVFPLIVETKAKLLVIDVLQKFIRVRDMNDYAIVTAALEPIMDAARKQNCHVMLTHHAGKLSREDGDDILGSTALLGGVDTLVQIKKHDKRRAFFTIQRYGDDIGETVIDLGPAGLTAVGSREDVEIEETKPLVLGILETETLTKPEIYERVERRKTIVSRAVDLLVESKALNRTGDGKRKDPYKFSIPLSPTTTGDSGAETKTASNPAESKEELCPRDFRDFSTGGDSFGAAFLTPEYAQKNGQKSTPIDADDEGFEDIPK